MSTEAEFNEPITVARDGQRPLRFKGQIIGHGSNRTDRGERNNRWTEVHIYRTESQKLVAQVEHFTQWDGESNTSEAAACDTPAELVQWLTDNGGGRLGGVSQEALREAAKADPAIEAAYVEEI